MIGIQKPTFIDWFAGIGGASLGLVRAGFKPLAACEINPYRRKVYGLRFGHEPQWADIRQVDPATIPWADVWWCSFPCKGISNAGRREGFEHPDTALWRVFARLLCDCPLRPKVVLVENPSALLGRGLGEVLGNLSACGYDAEWECIRASDVGAPHQRDRVFVVAYTAIRRTSAAQQPRQSCGTFEGGQDVANPGGYRRLPRGTGHTEKVSGGRQSDRGCLGERLADTVEPKLAFWKDQAALRKFAASTRSKS